MNDIPPDARALGRTALDPAALEAAALEAPGLDLGAGVADDEASPDAAGSGGAADGEHAGVVAERERLARQLRETRMQLALTQARLTALQNSATMALGKTLVNAAKRPWPRGAQLPRDLYRMWKDRGAPGKSGGANLATALAAAQLNDLKGTGGRFLSALTAPGAVSLADPVLGAAGAEPRRLVITGALTSLACATLAPDAVVHPLLPHDADVLIDGTGADLVIIEAAALLPGSPWAYATDPAAADRGRRLARMIVMARSLGKPVALVRNVPPALLPALGWVASACDVVWDEGLGVQLARFNPIGVAPGRPARPLYAADRDPRERPAVRALLDELTAGGAGEPVRVQVTGGRNWRGLPELYRGNGVFLTASPDQALEQLACGARVVGPVGSGADAAAVAAELAAATSAAALTAAGVRAGLREIFEVHATPVKLAGVARAAGLPAALVGGRQVTVLASVNDAAAARGLAAALLRQRLRPAEVIASAPAGRADLVTEALGALRDAGVRVRVTVSAAGAPVSGDLATGNPAAGKSGMTESGLARLAVLASAPWVAPWPAGDRPGAGLPGTYLLDLACARECAQADAVGFGTVDGDDAATGAAAGDYEFTQRLAEAALARRELFLPGSPPPGAWGARGFRTFSISRTAISDTVPPGTAAGDGTAAAQGTVAVEGTAALQGTAAIEGTATLEGAH
ncbi:MAG TPA: hypothetical protein VHZ03_18425 [Trebonia sp.]|nr:hypothetical protein [Trebonia sp.]